MFQGASAAHTNTGPQVRDPDSLRQGTQRFAVCLSEYEELSACSANHGGGGHIGASESLRYHNSLRSHRALCAVISK